MNPPAWLRKWVNNASHQGPALLKHHGATPLYGLLEEHLPGVWLVRISNGFLIMQRTHNNNGPDKISAHYVESLGDLAENIAAVMVAAQLK